MRPWRLSKAWNSELIQMARFPSGQQASPVEWLKDAPYERSKGRAITMDALKSQFTFPCDPMDKANFNLLALVQATQGPDLICHEDGS